MTHPITGPSRDSRRYGRPSHQVGHPPTGGSPSPHQGGRPRLPTLPESPLGGEPSIRLQGGDGSAVQPYLRSALAGRASSVRSTTRREDPMKLSTESLARSGGRHPWRTLIVWIVSLLAAAVLTIRVRHGWRPPERASDSVDSFMGSSLLVVLRTLDARPASADRRYG